MTAQRPRRLRAALLCCRIALAGGCFTTMARGGALTTTRRHQA